MKKNKILLTVLLVGVATIVAIPFLKELSTCDNRRGHDYRFVVLAKKVE